MKEESKEEVKSVWEPPQLIVHGTVAEITLRGGKRFGKGDGYFLSFQPIHNSSSLSYP